MTWLRLEQWSIDKTLVTKAPPKEKRFVHRDHLIKHAELDKQSSHIASVVCSKFVCRTLAVLFFFSGVCAHSLVGRRGSVSSSGGDWFPVPKGAMVTVREICIQCAPLIYVTFHCTAGRRGSVSSGGVLTDSGAEGSSSSSSDEDDDEPKHKIRAVSGALILVSGGEMSGKYSKNYEAEC